MTRVLVADDEDDIRSTLGQFLEEAGYEVALARDGNEAIKIHRQRAADVLVTDIMMPDCDGIELIRFMRGKSPEVRIIAISGGGKIDADRLLNIATMLGAERILQKPIDRNRFLETVEELLSSTGPPARLEKRRKDERRDS